MTLSQHKSYGIALCRTNLVGQTEIIMIKKRFTYSFYEFVMGKYKKNDNRSMTRLFNTMTFREKLDILGMNFNSLWCSIWNEIPSFNNETQYFQPKSTDNSSTCGTPEIKPRQPPLPPRSSKKYYVYYCKNKHKFNDLIIDGGKKLSFLINSSTNAETIWEIPKGRKNFGEKDINTALREFSEETGICQSRLSVEWHQPPVIESYVDGNILYKNIYYIARMVKPFEPKVYFNTKNLNYEAESVRWLGLGHIEFLQLVPGIKNRCKKLFINIAKRFKK